MSPVAERMLACAQEAMKLTRKYFVVELDFSEASLVQLESHVDDLDFAMPGGRTEENLQLLTRVWGSYLGEVIRRAAAGQWVDQAGQAGYPGLQLGGQVFFPHDHVRRRLGGDRGASLPELFREATGG